MREIKFRIIYKNKVHGYERITQKDGAIFWEWMSFDTNGEGRENWYRGTFPSGFLYERNQFTGLKDANLKEIYEGDIMRHREFRTNGVVEFKSGCFFLSGWDCVRTDFALGEVIGNIFETPELLK